MDNKMNCKKCNKEIEKYDNAFHKLCKECNIGRLDASKPTKLYKHTRKNKKSLKTSVSRIHRPTKGNKSTKVAYFGNKSSKSLVTKVMDEMFYEECFNSCTNHSCEECGESLPTEFRGDDGKVLYRARYSHIIAKSIAPELRYDINNVNHLCFKCHQLWEFETRKDMKIYKTNKERLPKYFK